MRVQAIMPCRGRPEQTLANVKRLLVTAGLAYGADWQLYLVGGNQESGLLPTIASQIAGETGISITIATSQHSRLTYWQALALGQTDAPLICNLANDLLPGQHWLQRAVAAYAQTFGEEPGMIGLNDGHHEAGHSCHFLIHRQLLARYGGWPVWYDHNYGDTELCQRAIADGLYAKAPWATLYHDHPYFGGADDATYAEGRAKADKDHQLYEWRRVRNWPTVQ